MPMAFDSEPQMQPLVPSTQELQETIGGHNQDQILIHDIREHAEGLSSDLHNIAAQTFTKPLGQNFPDGDSTMKLQGLKQNLGLTQGKKILTQKNLSTIWKQ